MFKLYIITIIVYADYDNDDFIFFSSQDLNLEEGTSRLVSGVEMNRISRSMREATKSVYETVAKCLGIIITSLCNLPRYLRGDAFWVFYMFSMMSDPVFLYVPVANDEKKCFQFDMLAMRVVIGERSVFDK